MNLIVGVREEEWEMKKGIIAVVLGLILLFGVACGKDAYENATTLPAEGAPGSSASAGNGEENVSETPTESEEGYLDEATGIYHTAYGISFSLPDGWLVVGDRLNVGAACIIGPEEGAGVIIELYRSSDSAQMEYDGDNENGRLGESHEVTYGSNTYVSNVEPTDDGEIYFYYSGKSDPVVFLWTNESVDNAALEEILTSFSY
jgi:hypothetical protein